MCWKKDVVYGYRDVVYCKKMLCNEKNMFCIEKRCCVLKTDVANWKKNVLYWKKYILYFILVPRCFVLLLVYYWYTKYTTSFSIRNILSCVHHIFLPIYNIFICTDIITTICCRLCLFPVFNVRFHFFFCDFHVFFPIFTPFLCKVVLASSSRSFPAPETRQNTLEIPLDHYAIRINA